MTHNSFTDHVKITASNIQNNSSEHELKRYTLFETSRGYFCTKIHKCYVGPACLLLTPLMLLCMQHQCGTTINLIGQK